MSFHLEIVTPEKKVFSGGIKKLTIPSVTGQLTILTDHLPLFTTLIEGEIKVTNLNDKVRKIPIGKGMIEVRKNKVSLLVEPPEHAERVVKLKAKTAEEKAGRFDKTKMVPKGKIPAKGAFRRSFIDFKDIKRKRKPRFAPTPPITE